MSGFKHAFSLSKAEVRNATPPGTTTLIEHLEWTASNQIHDEVRLVPQPTADPADPLNFSRLRKSGILFSMCLVPFVVNFTSASISSALPVYAATPIFGLPPKPFSELTHLLAVNILMLGASNLLWVPLSYIIGRRPVMLLSLLLLTLSSMWAGLTTSFDSLLAARIFMGVGGGPADAVSPDVVGEIFFVHQRGRVMAFYTVFLAAGSFVGPMAGGYIASHNGLAWIHWTNVILSAIAFVVCFFLQPETLYQRPIPAVLESADSPDKSVTVTKENVGATTTSTANDQSSYAPYTFVRSLKLFTWHGGVGKKFLAPYLTLRLPGVWLVSLWYAGLVGAIVTISAVGAQIVSSPPYLWGANAGLINAGALVGSVLGAIYTYFVADFTTKRLAKKDIHGYSEPESRIVTAIPALFISTAGTIILGLVAQNPSPKGWVGLQIAFGMVAFGLMQAPSVGFNYIIESYPTIAGDCFVAITCSRAIIAFAWTFFVGTWTHDAGYAQPFGIFGMLLGIFGLLTVPYWIWGKRFRIATAPWVESLL
ncbi:MFS general substrate transporter [Paraphaeosphaeria sporulosa]|uniref:MFS general substrate transporter n=1 Tax=Paraphaeosphaeria sporulosa TaxID=1460663 RepID=A0A177CD30_9PLEO|nr:MFS general substrate transporter [Paraphaeosphaeria sporulosa]OAG05554.1 MFS general substrate transporter [Paraphaeosphaeria sporulosa]